MLSLSRDIQNKGCTEDSLEYALKNEGVDLYEYINDFCEYNNLKHNLDVYDIMPRRYTYREPEELNIRG
jgi:hypothetical protein